MIEYALKDGHLEYGMVHESEQSPQASLKNFLSPLESLRGSQTMKGTAAMAASGTKIKSNSVLNIYLLRIKFMISVYYKFNIST